MAKNTKSGLGRGLNSLLGGYYEEPEQEKAPGKEQMQENPASSARERVVVESAELQEVINREMAAQKSHTPSSEKQETAEDAGDRAKAEENPVQRPEQDKMPSPEAVEPQIMVKETNELPLEMISPNPDQPRTYFKKEEIEELASSIEKDGLLQPIVVRPVGENAYQIIAGERRWQACKYLKLETVPVRIKDADEDKALELALIENIQRSDLNPIEEAYGYRRLMERMNLTQSEVAQVVSKGRSTIANALRLLELPEEAQQLLFEEKITAGHARAILSIPTSEGRQKLTAKLMEEKLSVRETEAIARLLAGKKNSSSAGTRTPTPSSFKKVAKTLRDVLHTNVKVKTVQGKNKIEIEFKDEEELQRLFNEIISANE